MPEGPGDLFTQMEFLHPGLLGTTSKRAFIAEFARVLPVTHPLVRSIAASLPRGVPPPQIVERDPDTGLPIWRNLDKLHALLAPHTFRIRKEECLDLPPKVYKVRRFDLPPAQRAAYDRMEQEFRVEVNGEEHHFNKLSSITKLQQITSGFVIVNGAVLRLEAAERLRLLMSIVSRQPGDRS